MLTTTWYSFFLGTVRISKGRVDQIRLPVDLELDVVMGSARPTVVARQAPTPPPNAVLRGVRTSLVYGGVG